MDGFAAYFRSFALEHPSWNFVYLYDPVQAGRVIDGIGLTVLLAVACITISVVIGVVGAGMQGSRSRVLRAVVQGYIQCFRNTPPFVQLLFFYFALGQFTPTYSPDGWLEMPIISNVGWAVISLSLFAGAFNVEIFRAGIEAVPHATREAAGALGFTRYQSYRYIVLPLAFRISLPALNNNLVNLVKTTTQAFAIAVPELLYQCVSIWNDYPSAQRPTMLLLFVVYIALVAIVVFAMHRWERALALPGFGR